MLAKDDQSDRDEFWATRSIGFRQYVVQKALPVWNELLFPPVGTVREIRDLGSDVTELTEEALRNNRRAEEVPNRLFDQFR